MEDSALLRQIIRRLDILIGLQIENLGGPEASRTATKIQRLSERGLSASEIASILGKPTNYITATLSIQKAQLLKKRKRSE